MKLEKILKAAATFEAQLKYPSTIVCGTAMAMADIPGFIPADLDVVIDPRDFHRLFPENTEYLHNERNTFKSFLQKTKLDGVDLDVISDIKTFLPGVANKKIELSFSLGTKRNYVRVGDRILSTITPAHQIRFYELLGREKDLEKAKIIAKHIGATEYSYRDKKQTPIRFATYVK